MDASQAVLLATAWLKAEGLPEDCVLTQRTTASGVHKFSVLRHVHGAKILCAKLKLSDEGSVIVTYDLRRYIRNLNLDGFYREKRFFDAVRERAEDTPPWFLTPKRATMMFDKRGIDGFLRVKIAGYKASSIPYQIKSSVKAAREHFEKHPGHCGIVSVLVVRDSDTDADLRNLAYTAAQLMKEQFEQGELDVEEFRELVRRCAGGLL